MKGGCSHRAERGLARGNEKPVKDLSQRPGSSGTCFRDHIGTDGTYVFRTLLGTSRLPYPDRSRKCLLLYLPSKVPPGQLDAASGILPLASVS